MSTHMPEYQARLGSALWQVDFYLYAMYVFPKKSGQGTLTNWSQGTRRSPHKLSTDVCQYLSAYNVATG